MLVRQAVETRRSTTRSWSWRLRVWSAFANHYWPALYFVDAKASSATSTSARDATSSPRRLIQELLGVDRELLVEGGSVEAAADWDQGTPRPISAAGA